MAISLKSPTVIEDLHGEFDSIDAAILARAGLPEFYLTLSVPHPGPNRSVPAIVSEITNHYQKRGFKTIYDGYSGMLTIEWDFPNLTWMEHANATRTTPDMVANLGIGFSAGLLYLCMLNGRNLISWCDRSLLAYLEKRMREAAALGVKEIYFPIEFNGVSIEVLGVLFSSSISTLESNGYTVVDIFGNYVVRMGDTLDFSGSTGEHADGPDV